MPDPHDPSHQYPTPDALARAAAEAAHGLVLVVEDDDELRGVLAEILASAGYEVRLARHGAEAIEKLCDSPRPHLILLDLMMPRVDGVAFHEIQQSYLRWARIPVVVLTAYPARAAELDVAAVLAKPCDAATLLSVVGQHLRVSVPGSA